MKKKALVFIMSGIIAAVSIAGCGSSKADNSPATAAEEHEPDISDASIKAAGAELVRYEQPYAYGAYANKDVELLDTVDGTATGSLKQGEEVELIGEYVDNGDPCGWFLILTADGSEGSVRQEDLNYYIDVDADGNKIEGDLQDLVQPR